MVATDVQSITTESTIWTYASCSVHHQHRNHNEIKQLPEENEENIGEKETMQSNSISYPWHETGKEHKH